jgi:hypothetical protein
VDVGAQDIEMPKLEGGEGFIDQVIKPRRLNALAFDRLRYPRRIQLLNLGLNWILKTRFFALVENARKRPFCFYCSTK